MIRRAYHLARNEARTFARFMLVGSLSFLLNLGLYALFSRWLYPQGDRVLENALAFLLSLIFNYAAHQAWTYRGQSKHLRQMLRYGVVVGGAAIFETFLFWYGHWQLKLYDFAVIVGATAMTAVFTFLGHRFYTFHEKPQPPEEPQPEATS
jgi:putative flippase GtrA